MLRCATDGAIPAQGYTIDFSNLTIETNSDGCTLTIYDGQDNTGTVKYQKTGNLDSDFADLSSYTFTSGYFYITWQSSLASSFNSVTASGNVTITASSSSAASTTYATGTVTGNGTISGTLEGDM